MAMSYVDLYQTMQQSLRHEIAEIPVFNATHIAVLKEYYRIIYKYFPFQNENVKVSQRFVKIENYLHFVFSACSNE